MRKIFASLDVGSSSLKLIIGEVFKNKVNVLACVNTISRGIKNGFIVNSESATEAFQELFDKANEIIGIPITKVIVSISPIGLSCFMEDSSVNITSEDQIIRFSDITNAMDEVVKKSVSANMQLVSISPAHFIIDDEKKIINPVGMMAAKLKVKCVVGVIPKKNINPLIRCLERINVNVIDIMISPLGDYYQFKTKEMQNEVGAIINIGASNTIVSIFNKGILTSSEVINIGGDNVTNDIAYVYKISLSDAEYLKENLCLAHKDMAQPNESVIIENKNGDNIKINQYDISEVAMQRLDEILNLAKKQINLLTKKEISYIIVTGGVTEFIDFNLILDEVFNHKAKIGSINEIGIRNNQYSSAYGLIKYYNSKLKLYNKEFSVFNLEEQEELGGTQKRININDNSILGKLFGYFFDN